jgi:hypothetical protein
MDNLQWGMDNLPDVQLGGGYLRKMKENLLAIWWGVGMKKSAQKRCITC